jgi:plasmid stability protein
MAQLTVRSVDQEIIRRLKIRAAEHGRSPEAEHREMLEPALLPAPAGKSGAGTSVSSAPTSGPSPAAAPI